MVFANFAFLIQKFLRRQKLADVNWKYLNSPQELYETRRQ